MSLLKVVGLLMMLGGTVAAFLIHRHYEKMRSGPGA